MLRQGNYVAALAAVERADRWPRGGAQHWIDYAKAEAYNGLGDRRLAERHYLRACASEPPNYWALIQLALFYASSDEPLDERRRRAAPYLQRLKEEFADMESLPRYLQRIERKLTGPSPGTAPAFLPAR